MVDMDRLKDDVAALLVDVHKRRLLERRKYVREVLDTENRARMKALMPREKQTVVLL
jgi:hypothetical protein